MKNKENRNKKFQMGQFCFKVEYPDNFSFPHNFLLFEQPHIHTDYTYQVVVVTQKFPQKAGICVMDREDIVIFQRADLEMRFLRLKEKQLIYACYKEITDTKAEIYIDLSCEEVIGLDTAFTSIFALERHISQHQSQILHCAYVKYENRAVLFSAPSGVGKSTQADLWEKYRKAEIINGDRALIEKKSVKNSEWFVSGWPVCGSSGICKNEQTALKAIVILDQGKENKSVRLSPAQAFAKIYGEMTINRWNQKQVTAALDFLQELVEDIPVFYLCCTISEKAVKCLETVLYREK